MNSKMRIHTYLHCPASLKGTQSIFEAFWELLERKNPTLLVEDLLQKESKRDPSNDKRVELTEINHQASYPWSEGELTVRKPIAALSPYFLEKERPREGNERATAATEGDD